MTVTVMTVKLEQRMRDCRSRDAYLQLASSLASDLPRLAHLRTTLRQKMKDSPLLDAPGFARHLEAAYREMWRLWCADS